MLITKKTLLILGKIKLSYKIRLFTLFSFFFDLFSQITIPSSSLFDLCCWNSNKGTVKHLQDIARTILFVLIAKEKLEPDTLTNDLNNGSSLI